ncbi:MAG: hypothetical protein JXB38_06510 [Anaerolineales bacterium]|nr:hypothetical protein [Anaerolineales bacterium]
MGVILLAVLTTINQVFEAGVAITAFSLFLRSLTFNLKDRVTFAFLVLLLCVVAIFTGEAMGGAVGRTTLLEIWLRFQWVGLIFFPPAFFHFADALLATTGRPSRGRRRLLLRLAYLTSAIFFFMLLFFKMVGPVNYVGEPVPYMERTWITLVFTLYYFLMLILAFSLIWRAYDRTVLSASRRRMGYLLVGSSFLGIGSYPYLLFGTGFALRFPHLFLVVAAMGNILVFTALVAMAYAVAFFGVPWPDRVIKIRLIKWLMRGPITVFVVLLLMTLVWRAGEAFNLPYSVAIPVVAVVSVLLMQHLITLGAPVIERWLFYRDESDLQTVSAFQDRLITDGDLRQFLEAVLASVCDQFQVSTAFIAALNQNRVEMYVPVGKKDLLPKDELPPDLLNAGAVQNGYTGVFSWENFWLLPLFADENDSEELLGLLGVFREMETELDPDHHYSLERLGARAAMVLANRKLQRQVIQEVESLSPKVDLIQRLRAASRYDQVDVLSDLEDLGIAEDMSKYVKDAFSHYWGGPKLTENPLMRLEVVQQAISDYDGNATNAMRAILQEALERIRPEGERRFTAEWILYNILEMKFLQGRKVRDVALRLAMSEADLYRKQRVAIEAVADAIIDMEQLAREGVTTQEEMVNYEI